MEVDEIVEPGELSPEEIVTPHLFVDGIIKAKKILTKDGVMIMMKYRRINCQASCPGINRPMYREPWHWDSNASGKIH